MRFYHACVTVQNVKLRAEEQHLQTPTQIERDDARTALEEAWVMLQSIQDLDLGSYERMNTHNLRQLRISS